MPVGMGAERQTSNIAIYAGLFNAVPAMAPLVLAILTEGVQQQFRFDGKCLIHPNQIEAANRLFSPPADEVAWARAVIAAFADPANRGRGALRVEGRLAEFLHLAQAEKLVATADAIAASEGAAAAA